MSDNKRKSEVFSILAAVCTGKLTPLDAQDKILALDTVRIKRKIPCPGNVYATKCKDRPKDNPCLDCRGTEYIYEYKDIQVDVGKLVKVIDKCIQFAMTLPITGYSEGMKKAMPEFLDLLREALPIPEGWEVDCG